MTSTAAGPEIGEQIDVAGIETNYHDRGSGSPLLLLHGSGAGVTAWANWSGLIPALESSYRVIAPDIVGFGYTSTPQDFVYEPRQWMHHVIGLMDALNVRRASVVGNSFGGALALRMAVEHPDRVDRLLLMGSAGLSFPLTQGLDAVWGYEPSVENMSRLLDYFLYDRSIVDPELAELRYRATLRPGVQESFSAMFPSPRQQALDRLALPEDALRSLPHRTLLVHGREDEVVPASSSQRLHELIPNADLHIFGKCGHWAQIERATDFAELVHTFLAKS